MPIANGDILRVVYKMSAYGADVQNVYHIRASVTSDPGDEVVLEEILAWLEEAYTSPAVQIVNEVTFDSVAVWNVTSETFIGEIASDSLTAGSNTGNNLPIQTAPLVLFNTNVNKSQGRKFLPWLSSAAIDGDGTPTSTVLTALGLFAGFILDGISGTGWTGIAGNWSEPKQRFVEWLWAVVVDRFATQRRRQYGVGS